MSRSLTADVAIVGGGPAGAALAIRLAGAGHRPVLFERSPQPLWRASGVYSSPLSRRRLTELGFSADELARLIQPIHQTVVETADGGASCVLAHRPEPACGIDRVRLEAALLERARSAGADVHEAAAVRRVDLDGGRPRLLVAQHGESVEWRARVVVGADGPASIVARAAGVARPQRRFRRAAVTGHRAAVAGSEMVGGANGSAATDAGFDPAEARMIIGSGWYLGIAPVPGKRVNLGLVIAEHELRRHVGGGAGLEGVMSWALRRAPAGDRHWLAAPATDRLTAQLPLAHRVARSSGDGFLLIGDAAGFIDPLSGEGLLRALATAELAQEAIGEVLAGRSIGYAEYDRRLRARFRSKDFASWLLQLFLFRPALAAHAIRRLDRRPVERRLFARALGDLAPASRLLDPRFLTRLLLA